MTGMKPKIILASGSPRRKKLLRDAGYEIEVIPSEAEENDATADDVHEMVVENARIKAMEVIQRLKSEGRVFTEDRVLVAADTLVVLGNKVYPKPVDMAEAEQFMNELGGHEHRVLTGVFLYNLANNTEKAFYEATRVTLQVLSPEQMYAIWEKVNPLDKAGAYGYQDSPKIVTSMHGSETNVIGLPMQRLAMTLPSLLSKRAKATRYLGPASS